MKDIKIFVSNRININSVQINNPLYIFVRCGAVFDTCKKIKMQGDNTGDNISERRNSFCEFTVQYWAWKNVDADYYGLCHYRRFLTFVNKKYKADVHGHIIEYFLNKSSMEKYGLINKQNMQKIIEDNDIIVNKAVNVLNIPTPQGKQKTVYGHWMGHDGLFLDKRVLPLLLQQINDKFPQYMDSAQQYLRGEWHRGYNCYVMKKEFFNEMCNFQFTILFDLENQLKNTEYVKKYERTLGYLGEIMYGIYVQYLYGQNKYKIYETQLVYFEETEEPKNVFQKYFKEALFILKFKCENIGFYVLPKASKRRNFIKKIYFKLIGR
ncbi:DUF4422 domain-containing protein [Pectinatus cerevisiiphilus]|uniref:Uncharacterized protein DUF4422 n=1 Tax=Pectinatus cerevisiiphilus TaxID=86956 RepID=A0A4R3K218_9FIRM|nr:DUF4422 domain-containing protein [Pectinatus cerevisiiphilus]TCS76021.1 uncharacterized protein DUF4422 [Pectinatus cerevisiiphilus]